jgi:hypothetical protein
LESERAGDAASGLRLIAREAQLLAERGAEASRKMLGLIQAAQADARTASEAVDRTTAQAVAGSNIGAAYNALLAAVAPAAATAAAIAKTIATESGASESQANRVLESVDRVAQGAAVAAKHAQLAKAPTTKSAEALVAATQAIGGAA